MNMQDKLNKDFPKKIIVRMPNWIGDLIMATPILTDLRANFPEAEITAMCKHPLSDLLKEDQDIDELFSFSRLPNGFARRKAKRNIIEKLREGDYDLGLLLTNSFSSAWWFWQGGVKERLGFSAHFRRFLLTCPVSWPKHKEHQVLHDKRLLKPLGIELSDSEPRIYLKKDEKEKALELLYQRGYIPGSTLIGIHPGAAYGEAKCWPAERYREIAKRLLDEDESTFLVFFGDTASFSMMKNICQGLSGRAINLAGTTNLRELSCLLAACSLLLTNDSGPMHIASALGTPVVALFGSTDPDLTGPYKNGLVINKKVECSPCFKRKCPIDFRCMTKITVEDVLQAVKKMLKKSYV